MEKESRKEKRKIRHLRIRKKIFGTPERPRLAVFKSLRYIYAQIIDDTKGHTLVSASSLEKELKSQLKSTDNIEAAKLVGKVIAKRALEKGIKKVVFDRGGFLYHGRIKALADSARAEGLEF
ncbi:MAG: 50S ribosomal protein L18 [Dictyoglomus sp.]|nr:50S ribosomal protein L18 [Dictyoglomus sp.]